MQTLIVQYFSHFAVFSIIYKSGFAIKNQSHDKFTKQKSLTNSITHFSGPFSTILMAFSKATFQCGRYGFVIFWENGPEVYYFTHFMKDPLAYVS